MVGKNWYMAFWFAKFTNFFHSKIFYIYSYGINVSFIIVTCVRRVDDLLAIKIADFGLAKDIYSTEYYRVDKHTTLPVKWMSLESLLDGYFDEKTDVVRS